MKCHSGGRRIDEEDQTLNSQGGTVPQVDPSKPRPDTPELLVSPPAPVKVEAVP
jgi:hypothetical protein